MIQPPGRIEQLNNFQDSVQSPDGLDRLRALQYIQEALPSTKAQGLMGMPQVTVPQMQPQGPMMNREDGGPVINKFGGGFFRKMIESDDVKKLLSPTVATPQVVEEPIPVPVPEDTMKVFARDQEGIRNRAIQGGVLEGQRYTPVGGGTTTAAIPTLKGFGSKEEAIAHHNQSGSGGLINVYQLDDGSWDYNRTEESPELMGMPTTPDAPINITQPVQKTFFRGDEPQGQALGLPIIPQTQFTFEDNQPQVVKQLGRPNIQGFKSKEAAMEHQRQSGGGGLVNVYQLPDGSWDYQRTSPGPMPIGMPVTPGGPAMAQGGYIQHREGGGQVDPAQAAQGIASLGRYGDNMLVHMNPEEVEGLMSLGKITYNPITGLPEAWGWGGIMKTVRKLAPIALAIAAPYAAAAWAPTLFGTTAAAGVGGMSALGFGAATGIGSFLGNKIAGAKTSDALKAGLMSGAMGGVGRGLSTGNWLGEGTGGTQMAGYGVKATPGTTITKAGLNTGAPTGYGKLAPPPSQFISPSPPTTSPRVGTYTYSPEGKVLTSPSVEGSGIQYTTDPSTLPSEEAIQAGGQLQYTEPVIHYETPDLQQTIGQSKLVVPTATEPSTLGTTVKQIGKDIWKDYGNLGGAAKIVGMDLMTPDWEANYAAEAAAKNQQLTDAGYTVETGFDGQTVIRDSSGVVQPKTLTVQQILDRALGKTPRTKLVADYRYEPAQDKREGGLISLKHGGEFSGIVSGDGHGMEDNVYMPIVEKGHGNQVGTLAVSPSEYVVDSYTMAALGNGNADAGAKVMDNVVKGVRKKAYGNMRQPNEINGLSALQPMMERANI